MAKECAVPRCGAIIGEWALTCLTHWRRIPRELRNNVNRTLRAYKEHISVETAQEYRDAVAAALASIEESQSTLNL